jgi:hypothetical protein
VHSKIDTKEAQVPMETVEKMFERNGKPETPESDGRGTYRKC